MAKSQIDIILKTIKQGSAAKETTDQLGELKKGLGGLVENLTGVNVGSLGVAAAIAGIGTALKSSIEDTVAYAAEVEALSRATGASSEESSRLIQVADDLRVEFDVLKLAMKAAAQQGINLTTEELAKMSDEYLRLAPGVERNQYLIQSFGRNGLEMAKILEVGSQAIRDMSAGVEDALVLNEEAIQQAKEFTMAEDALNDAFMAAKVSIGTKIIPVLTDYLEIEKKSLDAEGKRTDTWVRWIPLIGTVYESIFKLNLIFGDNKEKTDDATTSAQRNYEAMAQQVEAQRLLREQTDMATGAWQANEIALAQVKDAEDAVKLSNELLQQTYDPLAAALRGLTSEIIFQTAAQNLDADSALKLARDMGLVTDTQLMQTQKLKQLNDEYRAGRLTTDEYTTAVLALDDAIKGLEDRTVTVTVEQNWFQNQTQENPYTEVTGSQTLPGATTGIGTAEDVQPGANVSIGTVVLSGGMDYQSLVYRLKRDLGRR